MNWKQAGGKEGKNSEYKIKEVVDGFELAFGSVDG